MPRLILVVACVLVDASGRVLIARRPPGKSMAGLWEFPGGKIEPGETPEAALIRELHEELAARITQDRLMPLSFASHSYADFHLLMPVYLCRHWEGEISPREGQAIAWVKPSELAHGDGRYPMPPADIPLIPALRSLV